jgi:hypothetical protein
MSDEDVQLDKLFQEYRAACPDIEPSQNFMPTLWQRIEARRSFGWVFERMARTVVTASAVLSLLLLVLIFVSSSQTYISTPTYMDALMADQTAEKIYYTESLRPASAPDETPDFHQH